MKAVLTRWGLRLVLLIITLMFVYPFAWMFFSGFKSNLEIYRPLQLLPESFRAEYYRGLFSGEWLHYGTVYGNSFLIALGQALGAVLLTSMCGYVFAKCPLRGKPAWFMLSLLVILIPKQVVALPLFTWIQHIHLYDNLLGVVLPGIVSGVGVLFFTLAFRQVPDALLEQARMEGASEFRIYWTVLPLMHSALLTFGLIHFILSWHEHLIPLLILHEHLTLPLAMSSLQSSGLRFPQAIIMCASTLTILPTALIFALLYRRTRSALAELMAT